MALEGGVIAAVEPPGHSAAGYGEYGDREEWEHDEAEEEEDEEADGGGHAVAEFVRQAVAQKSMVRKKKKKKKRERPLRHGTPFLCSVHPSIHPSIHPPSSVAVPCCPCPRCTDSIPTKCECE
jgi:hypothetical protein